MALDRFVYWKDKKPTKDQVELVIKDYLDAALSEFQWDKDRFLIVLVGQNSAPLKSVADPDMRRILTSEDGQERFIEVYLDNNSLDVITRRGDEFTNNVADGLARIFARFWEAELQIG